jgi:alpha-tubulin suppressor-like RCC1 family protein
MTPAYRAALVGLLAVVALLLAAPFAYASGEIRHEVLKPYANGPLDEWSTTGPKNAWEAVNQTTKGSTYISASGKDKVQTIKLGKGGVEWRYQPGWTIKKVTFQFIAAASKSEIAEVTAFTLGSRFIPTSATTPEVFSSAWGSLQQTNWEGGTTTAYPFQVDFIETKSGSSKAYALWAEVEAEVPEPQFAITDEQRLKGESSYTTHSLAAEAGKKVEYRVTVEDTGSTALELEKLRDAKCANISPPSNTTLAPGAKEAFTCEHVLTAGDEKPYTDSATIAGHNASLGVNTEHTSNTLETEVLIPNFTVVTEQRVNGGSGYTTAEREAEVGQTLEYQTTVADTGGTTIRFQALKDEHCSNIVPSGETELKSGESESFTCQHVLGEGDMGTYSDVAAVEGAGTQKSSEAVEVEVLGRQVVAFGKNHFGQLGAGFLTHTKTNSEFEPNALVVPRAVEGAGGEVMEIAQGFKFAVARLRDGQVETWGRDEKGQLGYNVGEPEHTNSQWGNDAPRVIPSLKGVVKVAVAGLHAMALLENGTVMTWGVTEMGEDGTGRAGLEGFNQEQENKAGGEGGSEEEEEEEGEGGEGEGETEGGAEPLQEPEPQPVTLPEKATATAIAAGGQDDYALLNTKEVVAWGSTADGVLTLPKNPGAEEKERAVCGYGGPGLTKQEGEKEPEYKEKVKKARKADQLRWYEGHYGGEKDECPLLCYEEAGGVLPCDPEPHFIETGAGTTRLENILAIAAGQESAYAENTEGKLYGWGDDQQGQLGTGEPASAKGRTPAVVERVGEAYFGAASRIVEFAAGSGEEGSSAGQFVLARLENGTVYGWGNDGARELGMPPTCAPKHTCAQCANEFECVPTPTEIPGLSHLTVEKVFAGGKDGFALVHEPGFKGRLYAWGENGCGQLGLGDSQGGCAKSEGVVEVPTIANGTSHFAQISANEVETSGVLAQPQRAEPSFAASASASGATASVRVAWDFGEAGVKYTLRLCEQEQIPKCENGQPSGSTLPMEAHVSGSSGVETFYGVPTNKACDPPSAGFVANLANKSTIGKTFKADLAPCYEILLESEVNKEMRRRIIPDFSTGA